MNPVIKESTASIGRSTKPNVLQGPGEDPHFLKNYSISLFANRNLLLLSVERLLLVSNCITKENASK